MMICDIFISLDFLNFQIGKKKSKNPDFMMTFSKFLFLKITFSISFTLLPPLVSKKFFSEATWDRYQDKKEEV